MKYTTSTLYNVIFGCKHSPLFKFNQIIITHAFWYAGVSSMMLGIKEQQLCVEVCLKHKVAPSFDDVYSWGNIMRDIDMCIIIGRQRRV